MNATLPELHVANSLLRDKAALNEAWERDGYWFFRDVLDKRAVAEARHAYHEVLAQLGQVDRGDTRALWSGRSLDGFQEDPDALDAVKPWLKIVSAPAAHALFTFLLGDEPYWIPCLIQYRVVPPARDRTQSRLSFPHQDGFYNPGLDDFKTCWIPLHDIDAQTGGLAVAEGFHKRGYLHSAAGGPMFNFPPDAVPRELWRRSDYHAGDVVIFGKDLVHSGLTNHARHFRLSMDVRMMGASSRLPIVGRMVAADHVSLTVTQEDGKIVRVPVNEKTYCRSVMGPKISFLELVRNLGHQDDDAVIFIDVAGTATCIRPRRFD